MKNKNSSSNEQPTKRARRSDTESQCGACTRLFSPSSLPKLNSKAGLAHQTRDACEASIRNGCDLCNLISKLAFDEFGIGWGHHEPIVFRNFNPLKGSRAAVYTLRGTLEDEQGFITLYPFVKHDGPLGPLVSRRPILRDVQSPRVINAAKKLLYECRSLDKPNEGHEECRYSRDTVLPTRVLQVGVNEGAACPIQLHINDRDRCGSYLALSYCWGATDLTAKNNLVQLEKGNQKHLQKEIKMEDLEQTIQDAVYVTRQLGFNYLWVDRFCILQDDQEDKKREFSRMAITYKNAVVTLVAGTAKAASEGFLNIPSNNERFLPSRKFNISMEGGGKGVVYIPDKPYQPIHPIDTRGWTLQEFMLSSRMLIFSDHQLLWQCKQKDLQSVTGDDDGLEYQQGLESLPWAAFEDTAGPSFGAHDADKLYLWKTILRQYSERDLTNHGDRLPAITGVVTELQNVWKDTAIYGHWVEWFIQLLAWQKPEDDRAKERYLTRAPSWSWVSVNGRIHYDETIEKEDAKMEIVTAAKATISCRIVSGDIINKHAWRIMDQYFDLDNGAQRLETKGKICHYILLGTARECDGFENAIAVIAIEISHRVYRRIGLAVVADTSIWEGIKHQSIDLEPKQK
ncbi:hypothetical protein FCULG_00009221 [Fusarium culmorum]|uniref:Heterokaryon incompatibility domain-containing protein n=1 Tax=Fusarium culmorum TaxID=5516 RepID=A0A2T4GGJ1_FUSCU|nr:hypothetical protein FCULG_00009221 [Fusarium culmorum]